MTDYAALESRYPPDGDPVTALRALPVGADLTQVKTALETLARHTVGALALDRRVLRNDAIKELKRANVPDAAGLVDAALLGGGEDGPNNRQGATLVLPNPEPWPETVDGAVLLDDLVSALERFVALPEGAAVATALWVVHAHALDAFTVSPLLAVVSPEKRCGKTTLIEILGALVPRALSAANITPAVLFRVIERFCPTLLVDEADTFLDGKEELRGMLNAGHTRAGAFVLRTVGDDFEPRRFSTWAAKVVARIGELPETLEDRAIVVRMRRKGPGEHVERRHRDRLGELAPLSRRACRWARDHGEALRLADTDAPSGLHDRAADNWRPLLAIAHLAGGSWPSRARLATVTLTGTDTTVGPAVQLLGAVRTIFAARGSDRLATADLLADLHMRELEPWPTWNKGKPISARQVANLLRRFDIAPTTFRLGDQVLRGYPLPAFADAFVRYLPSDAQHPQQVKEDGENSESGVHNTPPQVAHHESDGSASGDLHVADVTDAESERDPDEETRAAIKGGA